jgi:hypothetical protein
MTVLIAAPIVALFAALQTAPCVDSAPRRAQMITVADGVQLEVLDF